MVPLGSTRSLMDVHWVTEGWSDALLALAAVKASSQICIVPGPLLSRPSCFSFFPQRMPSPSYTVDLPVTPGIITAFHACGPAPGMEWAQDFTTKLETLQGTLEAKMDANQAVLEAKVGAMLGNLEMKMEAKMDVHHANLGAKLIKLEASQGNFEARLRNEKSSCASASRGGWCEQGTVSPAERPSLAGGRSPEFLHPLESQLWGPLCSSQPSHSLLRWRI